MGGLAEFKEGRKEGGGEKEAEMKEGGGEGSRGGRSEFLIPKSAR